MNTNLTPARTRPFPRPTPNATGGAPPPLVGVNALPAGTSGATATPPAATVGGPQPLVFGDPAGGTNAPPVTPGPNLTGVEPVLLNFKDQPLDQVFDTYSRLSGKTVLRPATLPGAITIKNLTPLTIEEAIQALTTVLQLNNISLIPVPGDKFVKAVVANEAIFQGAPFDTKDTGLLPESEMFITHIVKLKYAAPEEVAPALAPLTKNATGVVAVPTAGIVVLRDTTAIVKRMLEVIEKIDTKVEPEYKLEIIPIKYGKVADIYESMNSLIGGSAGGGGGLGTTGGTGGRIGASGGRSGSSGRSLGRSGAGSSSRGGRGGGSYGGQGGNLGGINPQTGQPLSGAANRTGNVGGNRADFNSRIQSIVSRASNPGADVQILGDARIVPDERSNSLIVYANQEDMKMITNIVSKVDVLLAQVLIEAIVLQVDLGKKFDAGVSATQNRVDSGKFTGAGSSRNAGGTGLGILDPRNLLDPGNFAGAASSNGTATGSAPGGFSYFGKFGDKFDVALNLIASDSRANILQRPRIQTSHAVPGYFNIGNQVPYASIDPYGGGYYGGIGGAGGGLSTRTSVQYLDVGTSLEVTPFITPDGLVVMEIYQEISSFDGFEQISTDVKGPKSSYKKAEATLSVRDGDTILLGGYISDTKSKTKSGVPVLKDIPVLGNLFRSKSNSDSRSELVILLHVTVLKSPADASLQAESQKSAAIKSAERELQADEQARERALEKEESKKKKR